MIALWCPMWGAFKTAYPQWMKLKPSTPITPSPQHTQPSSSSVPSSPPTSPHLSAQQPQQHAHISIPDLPVSPCFQIFGFDLMLDDQLQLWLLEVNAQPSMHIDAPYDLGVKVSELFSFRYIHRYMCSFFV